MNIPPGYAQVNIVHSGVAAGRGAQITFGVIAPEPSTPTSVGNIIISAWRGHLRDLMSNQMLATHILVKFGPNTTGDQVQLPIGDVGDRSNPPDSPQVAALVTKRTAFGGRSNRGRWYLPYVIETDTDSGGILTPAARTLFETAVDGFRAELQTSTIDMVVLHNNEELTPTVVTSMDVQPLVATQRRRVRKVGGRRRLT